MVIKHKRENIRRRISLLVLALSLAGCGVIGTAPTPEDAARRDVFFNAPAEVVQTFKVLATHPWQRGAVVLYTFSQPPKAGWPRGQAFGYALVERARVGWGSSVGAATVMRPPFPEKWVKYSVDIFFTELGGKAGPNTVTVVFGQVLSPQVAAIEAIFEGREVVRTEAENGVFVLVVPGLVDLCELRVLGAENHVLESSAPGFLPGTGSPCRNTKFQGP